MNKQSCAIFMALALSGCGELNERTTYGLLNPARVDGDASRSLLPDQAERLIGDLSTLPQYQGTLASAWRMAIPKDEPTCPNPTDTMKEGAAGTVQSCPKDNSDGKELGTPTVAAKVFLMRGIEISDRLCAAWFDRLAADQAKLDFAANTVSNVGVLAASVMGFASVSSQAIGAVAAGTGFGANELRSAGDNFVIAPDVGVVQDAVNNLRIVTLAGIEAEDKYTYEDALRLLWAYDATCSHATVKRIVNQSIAHSTNNSGAGSAQLDAWLVPDIQGYFVPAVTVSGDDVVALYAYLTNQDLKGTYKSKLTTDKLLNADGTLNLISPKNEKQSRSTILMVFNSPAIKAELDAALSGGVVAAAKVDATPAAPGAAVGPAKATALKAIPVPALTPLDSFRVKHGLLPTVQ